jgi:hypothetical protein
MTTHGCKVCRVLDDRGLGHLEAELVDRWHGEADDTDGRMGYRRLADWLNARMLRAEMETVGMATRGEEAVSRYERLTADDAAVAAEVRDLLVDGGVRVDSLLDDFVSYSVVRTHLTDCLAEHRETTTTTTDWPDSRIAQLESYAASEASDVIRRLVAAEDVIAGDDPEVVATVELRCPACETTVPFDEVPRGKPFCDCNE